MYPYNNYPYQRQTSNIDWIMVQTVDQINQVIVQPNQKAWIMVQNEPVFAVRSADQVGLTNTEIYKFEKYERENQPMPEYVTTAQLEDAIRKIKEDIYESLNAPNKTTNTKQCKADASND